MTWNLSLNITFSYIELACNVLGHRKKCSPNNRACIVRAIENVFSLLDDLKSRSI